MSTFIRITISVIMFAVLFSYEWIHIKKEIKRHEINDTETTEYEFWFNKKQYIVFALIAYGIINITFIALFVFLFPNYIFLCTRKLMLVGGLILFFIILNLCFYFGIEKESYTYELFAIFSTIPFALILLSLLLPNQIGVTKLGTYEDTKSFYLVTNVSKNLDTDDKIIYIVTFKDHNPLVIKENEVNEFNFSTDTYLTCNSTITYYENTEKKEKEEFEETTNKYEICVNESLYTDCTSK